MIRPQDATFKTAVANIETLGNGNDDDKRTIDVVELRYPDGKVVAFPANDKSPESGIRYKDMYARKYQAFKNGDPDPDRVKELESDIAAKQAELKGLSKRGPDDKRLQENLGYGKIKPDADPHDATNRTAANVNPGKIAEPPARLGTTPGKLHAKAKNKKAA